MKKQEQKSSIWIRFLLFFLIAIGSPAINAQINYTYGWEPTGIGGWLDDSPSGSFSRSTTTPCTGTASLRANNYYQGESRVISPALIGNNGGNLTVEFKYKVTKFSSNSQGADLADFGEIRVEWATSNSGPWTIGQTFTSASHVVSASCATKSATLINIAPTGNVFIRLVAKSGNSSSDNYVYFDDILVTQGPAPTCLPPTNVLVSNVTTSGATLAWTASTTTPANGYAYEVRTDTNPGTAGAVVASTTAAGVVTTPVTGLTPNTAYNVYVKAVCSSSDSSAWTLVKSFRTPCVSVTTLPFTENFDTHGTGANAFPPCWARPVLYSGYPYIVAANPASSPNSLRFQSATNTPTYAITPSFSQDIHTLRVKFKLKRQGTNSGTMELGVMSDPTDLSTFEVVQVIDPSTNNMTEYVKDLNTTTLTGANRYIALRHKSNTTSSFYWLDDFSVDLIPSCLVPINVQVASVTKNAAAISWTAPNPAPANGYEYEIRTSGAAGSGATGLVLSGATAAGVLTQNLTALSPSTEYSVYVRSNCGASDKSQWTAVKKFTTLCDYFEITATQGATICGIGSAELSATSAGGTIQWFANATGGMPIFEGSVFETPVVSETTTYYARTAVTQGTQTVQIGTGTSSSSSSGTSPYYHGWGGQKVQYIYKASELVAAGVSAGEITSLSFDVVSAGSTLNNLSIHIGATTANAAGDYFITGLTQVVAPHSNTITAGMNSYTFTQPFVWDGTSNVVVQVSYSNNNDGGTSSSVKYHAAGFNSTGYYYDDEVTAAYMLGVTMTDDISGNRPNTYFNTTGACTSPRVPVVLEVTPAPEMALSASTAEICEGTATDVITIASGASHYTEFSWEPTTGVTGDAATGWSLNPTETTTYTLTATNAAGCAVQKTVTVEVNPLPSFTPLEEEYAVCQNAVQELNTNVFLGSEFIIGTATTKSSSSSFETAFMNRWSKTRQQYVYSKEELNAAGFTSGTILGLAFEVATLGSSANNTDYTIKMKQVTNSTITSTTFVNDGLITVYGPVSRTHTATGWQVINFTTPFEWDGTSSILIELTHGGANSSNNAETYYTQTSENTGIGVQQGSISPTTLGALTKNRLNTKFLLGAPPTVTWSPSADLYTDEAATVPYAGESLSKVYFKRSEAVSDAAYEVTISGANGCSTTLTTSISVPLIDTPEVAPQQFCSAIATSEIVATTEGGDLKWYNSATSETEITTISHSGVYYVSAESLGCKSDRVAVVITIAGVNAPTATPVQNFCGGATIASLSATSTTGHPLGWYSSATSTEELSADTILVTGTTYYVSEKVSNCESARVAVLVHVKPTPNSLPSQTYGICGFKTLANAEVGAQANATVTWYSSATANQAMNSNTQIVTGTYYASQTVDGCESARVAISFTVTQNLSVPTASAQIFCGSATVSQLVATGGQTGAVYLWYPTATATVPLSGTTALSNGTYYVSQKVGDCESGRKAVSVSLANTAAPSVSPYTFCTSATVADLTMPALSGVSYKWYSSPTSTNPLSSNTALVHNTTYYVSKVQGACESSRVGALVTILPAPSAPTGPTIQNFEIDIPSDATIGDLIVDQPNVVWYISLEDAKTNHNPLQSNMPLVNGQTYYGVLIGANGCPSAALAVTVGVSLDAPEFDRSMLKYYPNPVKDNLQISYKNVIDKVVVYNIIGQRVKEQKFQTTDVQVQMDDLSVGTYMLELHSKDQVQFIKIIKK